MTFSLDITAAEIEKSVLASEQYRNGWKANLLRGDCGTKENCKCGSIET
jgi:hypothetical protein